MGLWSGAFLNSSLTRQGGLISWRTNELTYIGGPGTKGLPGPRYELSGRPERACRARKSPPQRDKEAEEETGRWEPRAPESLRKKLKGKCGGVFFFSFRGESPSVKKKMSPNKCVLLTQSVCLCESAESV